MSVNVRNLPEVIFAIRKEFADVLRVHAGSESNPETARRFREAAAEFEAGLTKKDAQWLRTAQPKPRRPRRGIGDE